MKTLDELKQMNFIPHHECGCCGSMVGWYVCDGEVLFDASCDCGSSLSRRDTWENAFKWYNTAFERESEEAVNAKWEQYAASLRNAELSPVPLFELENALTGRSNKLFYGKAEADAYIHRLGAHHKYKRCLDKAKLCRAELGRYPSYGTPSKEERQLERHEAQWVRLAKKFKAECMPYG